MRGFCFTSILVLVIALELKANGDGCVDDQTVTANLSGCRYLHTGSEWDPAVPDTCLANLLISEFTQDDEGWTKHIPGDPGTSVSWFETGGNPDGYIRMNDAAQGIGDWFSAPAKFLGDKSAYYGGVLKFDIRHSHNRSGSQNGVRLIGDSITILSNVPRPKQFWQTYSIPFTGEYWTVQGTGFAATKEEILEVLGNIVSFNISGDWRSGTEQTSLDNVMFLAGFAYYELSGTTTGTGSTLDGVIFNHGETTVNWNITDDCLNVSICSFTLNLPGFDAAITTDKPPTVCENDSILLTTTEAISYLWNTGATTQSIYVDEGGEYSVIIIGSHCSDTVAITINSFPGIVGDVNALAPADSTYSIEEPITFSWSAAENAEAYDLFIWRTNQPKPLDPTVAGIAGTSYLHADYLNKNYMYYWQVTARNACTQSETQVKMFSFFVFTDLLVEEVIAPDSATGGQSINITFKVANTGSVNTGILPWKDNIYISASETYDTGSAILLASVNNVSSLVPEQSYINEVSINIPDTIEGEYFIYLRTDANNVIPETNEENNILRSDDALIITMPPFPDLAVSNVQSLNGNIIPGELLTVGWDVENVGDAVAAGGWSQRVAIISGAEIHVLGYVQTSDSLDASEIMPQQGTFMVSKHPGIEGEVILEVKLTPNPGLIEKPNATGNNTASSGSITLEKRLKIALPNPSIPENNPNPMQCMIFRSGNRSGALVVSLGVSETGRITLPESVTIPANHSGAMFQILAVDNGILEGDKEIEITSNASGYPEAITGLTIIDDEIPELTLSISVDEASEGDTIQLTITRSLVSEAPLTVNLLASRPNQFALPATAIIPASEASEIFNVWVIDNDVPELTEEVIIHASATGFVPDSDTVIIFDDDMPQLSLTLDPSLVSEGGGPLASWATVEIAEPFHQNLIIKISADTAGQVFFPSQVSIPKGHTSRKFNIGVIDNAILDGDRDVGITAAIYLNSCGCDATLETGGAVTKTLTILDNDGPSLSVLATPLIVPENISNAGFLTISRNTLGGPEITIYIQHNGEDEVELPESVIMPEDQNSVEVPFNTLDDGIEDGDQVVTITVSVADHSTGTCWLIVSDRNLPDYTVSTITLSEDTIVLNDPVQISFYILNQGFAMAPDSVEVKIYRSKNNHLDNSAVLIETLYTPAVLYAGDSIQMLTDYYPADVVGSNYIIATVNANGSFNELLLVNNTSSPASLTILPDYSATAWVDGSVFNGTSPITIKGKTETLLGNPAPNKPADVYLMVNGTRRVMTTESDNDGEFTMTFTTLNGEGGDYELGACYPGQGLNDVQDEFTVLGARHTKKGYILWDLNLDETKPLSLDIRNVSSTTLSNVLIEVISSPPGCDVSFNSLGSLAGNSTATMNYSVTGVQVTTGKMYEEVKLRLTSAEGTVFNFSVWFFCRATKGNLRLEPSSLNKAMVRGETNYAEFLIVNNGLDSTGQIALLLPSNNWMSLAAESNIFPSLAPGESASIVLQLTPGEDLQLNNPIFGQIAISGSNSNSVALPFSFEPVSFATGNLLVDVVNEYTYNTPEGPHLEGASVVLTHPYTGQVIAQGISDVNGHFLIEGINEGFYSLKVHAPQHSGYQNMIYVEKGFTVNEVIFLSFQAITYSWEVVPTLIQDEYEIKLLATFETNVPAPVVTMDLPDSIPQLGIGQVFPFLLTLTNHGLITAEEVELTFPDDPEYDFITNIGTFDLLPNSSAVIPVLVERKEPARDNEGIILCRDLMIASYKFDCGPDMQLRIVRDEIKYEERNCVTVHPGSFAGLPKCWPWCWNNGVILESNPFGPPPAIINGFIPPFQNPTLEYQHVSRACNPCIEDLMNALWNCSPIPTDFIEGTDNLILSGVAADFLNQAARKFKNLAKKIKCPLDISLSLFCFIFQAIGNSESGRDQVPAEILQAYDDFLMVDKAFNAIHNSIKEIYGNESLIEREAFRVLNDSVAKNIEDELPLDTARINELITMLAGSDIPEAEILDFANRWNTTLEAWDLNIYSPTPEYTDIIDTLLIYDYSLDYDSAMNYANIRGYVSIFELYNAAHELAESYAVQQSSQVCAKVSVQFSQTLTMAREAFEGTLKIFNGHESLAMENIHLQLEIKDEDGILRNNLFQINTQTLDKITGIDGGGSLESLNEGVATILFIPTRDAAPEMSQIYFFGGKLSYLDPFTGLIFEQPLYPVPLQVNPSPDLFLDYFMQRDILGDDPFTEPVEPSIPAELAVMIENKGAGTAYGVNIQSSQPQIIDNQKGLLIDFKIVGSNLGGQPKNLGLNDVKFGNIEGSDIAVGQWWFTSSLLGHFVAYEASVKHMNSFGNPNLSLISSVDLHELIKSVRVYGPADDGINDFLVNAIPDIEDVPDVLYYSNGLVEPVIPANSATVSGPVNMNNLSIELTVTPSGTGWNYIKLNDPGNGNYAIASCIRSDSQVIPTDNIWLTHVTIPDGGLPVYENKLHFIDIFEEAVPYTYTVTFEPENLNLPEVVAFGGIPAGVTDAQVLWFNVVFNKPIDPATFDHGDITLSIQGGPDQIDETVEITQLNDTVFHVDISSKTNANGFFVLTVQAAGIADLEGNYGQLGKQVTWTQAISTPAITYFAGLPVSPGPPIDELEVLFNMPVIPATFTSNQLVLTDEDETPISTEALIITSESANDNHFRITGLAGLTSTDGTYHLTFRVTEIQGETGLYGMLDQTVSWTTCLVDPPLVEAGEDESICPGEIIQLNAILEDASSILWTTSGSGSFSDDEIPNPVYTPSATDVSSGSVKLTLTAYPSHPCAPVVSDEITLTILPLIGNAVSIVASAYYLCEGTMVTFTAIPVNGGSEPVYQWKLNGINVGTNSSHFQTSALAPGDQVQVLMSSSYPCPSPVTSTSNIISPFIIPVVIPTVSITASDTVAVEGTIVTFTAVTENQGDFPYFEWFVNGNYTGFAYNVFETNELENGDEVQVFMYSDIQCAVNPAVSNVIQMTIEPDTTVRCPEIFVASIYQAEFPLTIGLPLGGDYSGPGVSGNMFDPAVAGLGEHIITYTYTNPETNFTKHCTFPLIVNDLPLSGVLQNLVINEPEEVCYEAFETITIAGSGTHFIVESGASAEIVVSQLISVKDGAHFRNGAHGILRLEKGNSFCEIPASLVAAVHDSEGLLPETPDIKTGSDGGDRLFFITYPNPTTGVFVLEISEVLENSNIIIEIYGIAGIQIERRELPVKKHYEFDLTDKLPGIYIICLISNDKAGVGKIILR